MMLTSSVISTDYEKTTNVFVNGSLVGIHHKPKELYNYMRLLKLNSFINILTSISWNIRENEIHIFSDLFPMPLQAGSQARQQADPRPVNRQGEEQELSPQPQSPQPHGIPTHRTPTPAARTASSK